LENAYIYLENAYISAHWVYKNSTSFDAFQQQLSNIYNILSYKNG
jgi:hypothetical protein